MQVEPEKSVLRLVKSASRTHGTPCGTSPMDKARAYYRQMKLYAQKIRRSDDIDAIIGILEEVLVDTHGLRHDRSLRLAREEVERAERKISALRDELEQTRRLVHVDHLTGAFNRAGLDRIFAREAAYADRHDTTLSVGLLDIDDFKVLNDVHGHQVGDKALVHLAQVMKQSLRPSDAVVRFGGEEFLLLLGAIHLQRRRNGAPPAGSAERGHCAGGPRPLRGQTHRQAPRRHDRMSLLQAGAGAGARCIPAGRCVRVKGSPAHSFHPSSPPCRLKLPPQCAVTASDSSPSRVGAGRPAPTGSR
jgi:diguanylate cyclase